MSLIDEAAPGLPGLETLRALIALGGRMPIGELLDIALVDVGDGWARFSGRPGTCAYNPLGTVHGGYAATLLDSACGCAVHSELTADQIYTTLELKVAFMKAITARVGPLRAQGRVQSLGRRVAFAEADVRDAEGRVYATATSTLLVMGRRAREP